MPPYAVIELSEICSATLAAAIGPQLSAQNVEHCPSTGLGRSSTSLSGAVNRTGLVVTLKATPGQKIMTSVSKIQHFPDVTEHLGSFLPAVKILLTASGYCMTNRLYLFARLVRMRLLGTHWNQRITLIQSFMTRNFIIHFCSNFRKYFC